MSHHYLPLALPIVGKQPVRSHATETMARGHLRIAQSSISDIQGGRTARINAPATGNTSTNKRSSRVKMPTFVPALAFSSRSKVKCVSGHLMLTFQATNQDMHHVNEGTATMIAHLYVLSSFPSSFFRRKMDHATGNLFATIPFRFPIPVWTVRYNCVLTFRMLHPSPKGSICHY